MSRGRDVAEGTLPQWTVLFEMTAGSTLETPVVVGGSRMDGGLSSKGSSPVRGAPDGRSGAGDKVWVHAAVSCRRKDGRNHPSESRKIEGGVRSVGEAEGVRGEDSVPEWGPLVRWGWSRPGWSSRRERGR